MSHFETLLYEYYDWQGYIVKRNIKVGRRTMGGWEMELDIIAYDPHENKVIHLEPSLDADSWARREERYQKKFQAGRDYIYKEIFTWLPPYTPLEQISILPAHPADRPTLAGGSLFSVDEYVLKIKLDIIAQGAAYHNAIPEQYPLLRTLQLALRGYNRALPLESEDPV